MLCYAQWEVSELLGLTKGIDRCEEHAFHLNKLNQEGSNCSGGMHGLHNRSHRQVCWCQYTDPWLPSLPCWMKLLLSCGWREGLLTSRQSSQPVLGMLSGLDQKRLACYWWSSSAWHGLSSIHSAKRSLCFTWLWWQSGTSKMAFSSDRPPLSRVLLYIFDGTTTY